MLECRNKQCEQNEKGKCTFLKDISFCEKMKMYEYGLALETSTHTPNYAEEQLEHAKEEKTKCYSKECPNNKENKCVQYCDEFSCLDRIAKPINYGEEYWKLKESLKIITKERDNARRECEKIRKESAKNYDDYTEHLEIQEKENERIKNEFIIENKELKKSASEATQQYLKIFDEKYELKAELTQLRNERQETEFKLKRYAASEIGYKKIILGLTQAFKELSKNIYVDELED